jgi:glycosyltransferase involved in cell wall biosynthesis
VVAANPRGLLYRRLSTKGLPVCSLAVRNHLDILAGLRLRQLVRIEKYNLVHFHTARAHALSPWLAGLPVKRLVTRRMDYPLKKGVATRFLYRQQVDAVVAISKGVYDALFAADVPATQLQIIPSGINTARFTQDPQVRAQIRQSFGFAEHETVVLSVGALVERKAHHTLLHAAHQLKEQGLHLRYIICGEGNLRSKLEAETHTRGLNAEVCFAGFYNDMSTVFAAADVFVHVPLWEGLGVAVMEAMAAGVPVIASRVGGIPDLINDHQTGLLVPPQDATALAIAVRSCVQDPQLARILGHAGQIHARTHFDAALMARRNEVLYYKLVGLS